MILSLASCARKTSEVPVEVVVTEQVSEDTMDTAPVDAIEITPERVVYNETETVLTDLVHTKLEVNFNWGQSRMNGVATITAKPHFYSSDKLILDAKGMTINSVSMKGTNLKYTYDNAFLTIELGKVYSRTEKYTVVIDYVAKPDEIEEGHGVAITSDKGLYFINPKGEENNKMPQIWTQGETEASSVWFPTIDSPNAKTSQEIYITVDQKYATLSNGTLMSSVKVAGGKRVDHWKQDLMHAPYLFMMGVGEFKIVKDSYTRQDGSKMEVNYYVEPEWEGVAQDIFGETPEMIKFFSEKLGVEYPWDKYHQIVVRDYVSGAMENTGAVIFGDYVYKNKRELLDDNDQSTIAHELFHHWFGDLVTCESWSNLTLNESFANYSQYLWDEHRYGLDEADYHAEQERDGYYQSAQVQGYHNLVWFDYDEKDQMFDGHSYNKGGRILHMLRNYLGDDAFFTAMNVYLEENKFKAAEFHQLRLAFEKVSGEDLNWFFNQWYLGSGHPTLKFSQTDDAINKTITITVEQTQDLEEFPIFKLPFKMTTFDDAGKHIHDVVVDEVNESFTFSYEGALKGILYDEQHMLLAKIIEDKTTEQYIYQYYHGERYESRKMGLTKGIRNRKAEGQQLILDAMSDEFWDIRKIAVSKIGKLKDENKEKGKALLVKMAKEDKKSDVRGACLKYAKKVLTDQEMETLYMDRIQNDQSYAVVSAALSSLGAISPALALKLAEELEKERSSSMLSGIGQLYSGYGEKDKFEFFEKTFDGNVAQGFDRLGLLNSFTIFLTKRDPEILKAAAPVYAKLGDNAGMYMKMFLPQNTAYLVKHCEAQIKDLNSDLLKLEKSDDAVYADRTRKKIAAFNECKSIYEAFQSEE